jgi:hypothetical protein
VPEPRRYAMQGQPQYVSEPPPHRTYYDRPAESSPPSSYRHYAHSEANYPPYAPAPRQWQPPDWRQGPPSHRPYETSPRQSAPDHYPPPRVHQYPHHGAPDASPWRAPAVPHHGQEYAASDQQGAMGPPQHVEHGYHSAHRPPSQGPPHGSPRGAPPPPFPKMSARQVVLDGTNGSGAREEDEAAAAAEWREGGARPRSSPPAVARSPEEGMGGGAEQGFRAAGYGGYERREA